MGLLDKILGKRPKQAEMTHRIISGVSLFMEASMALINRDELRTCLERQIAVYAYAFGAIDAVANANKLSQGATLGIMYLFFQEYFELSEEVCAEAVRLVMDVSNDPSLQPIMHEGGRSIIQWLSKQDDNAPISLFDIIESIVPQADA